MPTRCRRQTRTERWHYLESGFILTDASTPDQRRVSGGNADRNVQGSVFAFQSADRSSHLSSETLTATLQAAKLRFVLMCICLRSPRSFCSECLTFNSLILRRTVTKILVSRWPPSLSSPLSFGRTESQGGSLPYRAAPPSSRSGDRFRSSSHGKERNRLYARANL